MYSCTLKKSKKETCFAISPSSSASCLKKNMLVSLASTMSGCLRESLTRSSLSLRLSRPRQNAMGDLSSHLGPVLAWADNRSRVTLQVRKELASYDILHDWYCGMDTKCVNVDYHTKKDGIHIKVRKSSNKFPKKPSMPRLDV